MMDGFKKFDTIRNIQYIVDTFVQESCAIAKMTALDRVSRCGDMIIRYYPRWRPAANLDLV